MAKTNRHKYITQRSEFDLMCLIAIYGVTLHEDFCAIEAIGGKGGICENSCQECIQKWLNEEADG